jgi:hypothetical protein
MTAVTNDINSADEIWSGRPTDYEISYEQLTEGNTYLVEMRERYGELEAAKDRAEYQEKIGSLADAYAEVHAEIMSTHVSDDMTSAQILEIINDLNWKSRTVKGDWDKRPVTPSTK